MRNAAIVLVAALFACSSPGRLRSTPAQNAPAPITVAAAADLTFAFKDIAASYERETGGSVTLSFGSSGNFFTQIQNGAPFDLFFSADVTYPQRLAEAGLIEPNSLYPYAAGKIVLWAPNGSRVDLTRGLTGLADPALRRIAIANPEHAPYGRAAVAALRHDHVYDAVRDRLVLGENIAQAAEFVVSGNADAGIVALSLALSPSMKSKGNYVEIPPSSYPALVQAAVILKSSAHKDAARRFLDYLRRPEIAGKMAEYGFTPPPRPDSKGDAH